MRKLTAILAMALVAATIVSVARPARADNLMLTCKSGFSQVNFGHSSYFVSQMTYLSFYFTQWKPTNTPLQNGQCSLQGRNFQPGDPSCVLADVGQLDVLMRNGSIYTMSFSEHPSLAGFVQGGGNVQHFKAHVENPCWKVDW